MIEMRDLSKSYIERNGEERRVFEGLSFSPEKGERSIAITGRSGAGKTTLLRIIAGLDVQYGGEYWLDGGLQEKSLRAMAKVRRERIGVVPPGWHAAWRQKRNRERQDCGSSKV